MAIRSLLVVFTLCMSANAQIKYYHNTSKPDLPAYAFVGYVNLGHGDMISGGDGFGYCAGDGGGSVDQHALEIAGTAIAAAVGAENPTVGAFLGTSLGKLADFVVPQSGGSLKEFLVKLGVVKEHAACGTISIVVPEGSKNINVSALAHDDAVPGSAWADCFTTVGGDQHPCNVATAGTGIVNHAAWLWRIDGRVVTGLFKNWSHNRSRSSQFRVYFTPPQEWARKHPFSKKVEQL